MNNKPKKTNGVTALSPDLEAVRQQIVVDELKARHWRAQYEVAYYHIQFDKILPEYEALLERQKQEREEYDKKKNDFLEKLKENPAVTEIAEVEPIPNEFKED